MFDDGLIGKQLYDFKPAKKMSVKGVSAKASLINRNLVSRAKELSKPGAASKKGSRQRSAILEK